MAVSRRGLIFSDGVQVGLAANEGGDVRLRSRKGASKQSILLPPPETARLYTATLIHCSGNEIVHGFYAVVDTTISNFLCSLLVRLGPDAVSRASFARGFDPSDPVVVALVSDAVSDMLLLVDAEPSSSLGDGLDIRFESRFRNS